MTFYTSKFSYRNNYYVIGITNSSNAGYPYEVLYMHVHVMAPGQRLYG